MQLRLITIPISHFCEKARWALQRAGRDFVEEGHLQVLHAFAVRRAGGVGTMVPVLVTPDRVVPDSTEILRWVDAGLREEDRLFPSKDGEVAHWEERCDEQLGPDSRLWAYQVFLLRPFVALRFGSRGVRPVERLLFPVFFPVMGTLVKAHYRIDRRSAAAAADRCRRLYDEVAALLDDGRPYLTGERFTAADLAFASLSAPLILPRQYGVPIVQPEQLSASDRRPFLEFRDHPAGRFALRLYAEERGGVVPRR